LVRIALKKGTSASTSEVPLNCFVVELNNKLFNHIVSFAGGALLNATSAPGYHIMIPFITVHEDMQITMQTDKVEQIPCGTSGGSVIVFDKIEVVNRLKSEFVIETLRNYSTSYDQDMIFSKIHHEINQWCSGHSLQEVFIDKFDQLDDALLKSLQDSCNVWAPGIEIIAVRVTKPRIPESVRAAFENMQIESSKVTMAIEHQKRVEREAEAQRKKAVMEAEKQFAVEKIVSEKRISEKEAERDLFSIEDDMMVARAKAQADAAFDSAVKQSASDKLLLTDEYLRLLKVEGMLSNSRFYLGSDIPTNFVPTNQAANVPNVQL
jgi:regulator of protease activity HflC (stomatin/prohibitin superfamily)